MGVEDELARTLPVRDGESSMNRTVAEVARILGVDGQQLKVWAWAYKDYLSNLANPGKGKSRAFTDSDVLALMYICDLSTSDEPSDEIRAGLGRECHYDNDRYREIVYAHTPILQEPPDDLDETWRHGILLNGAGVDGYLTHARNYRESAETLLETALKSGEPRDWGFPVLYAYRHTLELYLKIIGEIDDHIHSLKECVQRVERRHSQQLPSPARDWIIELDKIDPIGTAFRYADEDAGKEMTYVEYWLDFIQFKFAMALVFRMLDRAILNAARAGKIETLRL
jgi:hypothetical protein